jgi:hypothetical protein
MDLFKKTVYRMTIVRLAERSVAIILEEPSATLSP